MCIICHFEFACCVLFVAVAQRTCYTLHFVYDNMNLSLYRKVVKTVVYQNRLPIFENRLPLPL